MLNFVFKGLLLFCTILLPITSAVYADNTEAEQGEVEEGIVMYHIKYDYDVISNFLEMSLDEYEQHWNEGLSIAEMAKKQGVSRRDLEGFFVSLHYKEMQKWRAKGPLTEKGYFDLVYRLSDDIEEFIDRNPNRKSN